MFVCMGWPANSLYKTGSWSSQGGLVFSLTFHEKWHVFVVRQMPSVEPVHKGFLVAFV